VLQREAGAELRGCAWVRPRATRSVVPGTAGARRIPAPVPVRSLVPFDRAQSQRCGADGGCRARRVRGAHVTMEALIDALRAEGGTLAEHVDRAAPGPAVLGPPQKAALGPRALGNEAEYELLLEIILEG